MGPQRTLYCWKKNPSVHLCTTEFTEFPSGMDPKHKEQVGKVYAVFWDDRHELIKMTDSVKKNSLRIFLGANSAEDWRIAAEKEPRILLNSLIDEEEITKVVLNLMNKNLLPSEVISFALNEWGDRVNAMIDSGKINFGRIQHMRDPTFPLSVKLRIIKKGTITSRTIDVWKNFIVGSKQEERIELIGAMFADFQVFDGIIGRRVIQEFLREVQVETHTYLFDESTIIQFLACFGPKTIGTTKYGKYAYQDVMVSAAQLCSTELMHTLLNKFLDEGHLTLGDVHEKYVTNELRKAYGGKIKMTPTECLDFVANAITNFNDAQ